MKKATIGAVIIALLLGSCESREQLQGAYMGGVLGGIFGSAVGGLSDGPRGRDAGAAMGVLIGATVGAAAATNTAATATTSKSESVSDADVDAYNRHGTSKSTQMTQVLPVDIANLEIENLRFIDENDNHMLERDELAEIVFEVRNTADYTIYDVTPVVTTLDPKHISVSSPAIIGHIEGGKAVRYKAKVLPNGKLDDGEVGFKIGFADGEDVYNRREFTLQTMSSKGR